MKPEELAACQGGRANSQVLVLAAPQPWEIKMMILEMMCITMMVEMIMIKTMMACKDVKANSLEVVWAAPRPWVIIIKMILVLVRMKIHQKLQQTAPI